MFGKINGRLLFVATLFTIGFMSCGLQNRIVLEGEGRGTLAVSLELPPYMLSSIDILADSIPGGAELLEPENIAKKLEETKDISTIKVESSRKGAYEISFRFQNFNQKSTNSAQQFLEWKELPGGKTRLSLKLNRRTYTSLEDRFPAMRQNTLLQLYGPASTEGMSRNDYLDMIEYSFGEEARKDLPEAVAKIQIVVPGSIVSQHGGRKRNAKEVEFTIPLLDLALLKQEKNYSIIYQ